ncbi:MAG: hypothetical protein M3P95_06140 [Actinomycetota bacterium]|nr:hypothetical protein [Actinomycetota bacterium]
MRGRETLADMSLRLRIGEIAAAIRAARFPPPPRRRYDVEGEALARPFGESAGRGPIRAGGVVDDNDRQPGR